VNEYKEDQKHFLWTMPGPFSSYSLLLIHMVVKVAREERTEPPIQTEYFLSGGQTTLTLMSPDYISKMSLESLSARPENMVEPPERIRLL
jgi:hypothetical protein